jgi:hypothetical protein
MALASNISMERSPKTRAYNCLNHGSGWQRWARCPIHDRDRGAGRFEGGDEPRAMKGMALEYRGFIRGGQGLNDAELPARSNVAPEESVDARRS